MNAPNWWSVALIATIALASSCGPAADPVSQSPPDAGAIRQRDVLEAGAVEEPAVSLIAIEVRDVNAVGRTVRFRGRAMNHYEQAIDGVSYRLRLFSTEGGRVLRTEYRDIDGAIPAGETRAFEIELESMYFATVPRFTIDAIPRHLGGNDFPEPANWGH